MGSCCAVVIKMLDGVGYLARVTRRAFLRFFKQREGKPMEAGRHLI